jgi:hypothetical protein
MLDDRGVQCKGCYEKSDFVDKLKATIHLPLKGAAAPKQKPQGAKAGRCRLSVSIPMLKLESTYCGVCKLQSSTLETRIW